MSHDEDGPIFTATFLSTAFAGGDIMTALSSGLSRLKILSIALQQVTTAPQAMSVEVFRSSTSVGAGGATITPINLDGWPNARAAVTSVLGPPSAGNSTASAERLHAGGFSAGEGEYCWEPCYPPSMSLNDSFHIRASTLASGSVILAATLTFREVGRIPG